MLLLVLTIAVFPTVGAVLCKQCVNVTNYKHCNEDCSGDFCFLEREGGEAGGGERGGVYQGCLQGLGMGLKQGCYGNSRFCLCAEEKCNELPSRRAFLNRDNSQQKLLSCRQFHAVNNNSKYDKHCSGHRCWLREEWLPDGVVERSGDCRPPPHSAAFGPLLPAAAAPLLPDACYSLQIDEGAVVRDCVCSGQAPCDALMEQGPDVPYPGGMVECQMLRRGTNEEATSGVCLGHLCFLIARKIHVTADLHVLSFHKGCLNTSDIPAARAFARPGSRYFSKGGEQEEVWLCSSPKCNAHRVLAASASKPKPPYTAVPSKPTMPEPVLHPLFAAPSRQSPRPRFPEPVVRVPDVKMHPQRQPVKTMMSKAGSKGGGMTETVMISRVMNGPRPRSAGPLFLLSPFAVPLILVAMCL